MTSSGWTLILCLYVTTRCPGAQCQRVTHLQPTRASQVPPPGSLLTSADRNVISGADQAGSTNHEPGDVLRMARPAVVGTGTPKYNQYPTSVEYENREFGNEQVWSPFQKSRQMTRVKRAILQFSGGTSKRNQLSGNGNNNRLRSTETSCIIPTVHNNYSCWHNSTHVNCSSRDLQQVPNEEYGATILWFDLHDNKISALKNNSFVGYDQLIYLDLSSNHISCMSVDAFQGLGQLKKLYLWNNKLDLHLSRYHPEVFSPLIALEVLFLNNNTLNGSNSFGYPDRALSKLVTLQTLQMDGLENVTFGPGFRNMTSLVSLNVSGYHDGYCKMTSLTNETFVNLQHLQHLNLSSCYVKGKFIEAGAFLPLRSLVSLDLTHNEDIDIVNLDKVFYGLHDTKTLTHLKMHLIVNRYSVGICLDSSYIRHFPKYLEYFDAQENNLEALDRQVISKLSPSLKSLDVSGNKFVFGTYLLDLHRMKNLTSLKINGGSFVYNLPNLYPYELSKYGLQSNCTLYGHTDVQLFKPFVLDLPPNLETIEMNEAGLKYMLSELNATHNNLKHLSLRGNYFSELIGPFHKFHKLERLDLSFCQVQFISSYFFRSFRSLKNLSLNNNQLGDFFSERQARNETSVFFGLTSLSRLDLSSNNIRKLNPGIFKRLESLSVLLLANNSMINFTVDISSLTKLTVLDLSRNQISSLPADTRTVIDYHLKHVTHMEINMAQCSILCECVNLEFLQWMTGSRAFDRRFQGYLCVKEDSSIMPITDGYNSTLDELGHACTSHVTIFFFVGAGTVVMFCVILGGIIYRFRWKIRYLYYAAYLQYKRLDRKRDTGFQYDAFVSYDHSDEEFVVRTLCSELESRNLKLCIHGRDFKAGDYIASNVVKSVCNSRKTVVVLTRNMVKSYWCGYEIQMANMESIHTGRQVLVFLIMEKIPASDLGVELLYNIRNNTYVPYPENQLDTGSLNRLWDKLANDIKE